MEQLLKVALRHQAIYLQVNNTYKGQTLAPTTAVLVANMAKFGFGVTEPLLIALDNINPAKQVDIQSGFADVMGIKKNWTPLVKGWDTPTGESYFDHLMVMLGDGFTEDGYIFPCGHIIPLNTFPVERYNGCPFCGKPFIAGDLKLKGQGSQPKVLELFTDKEMVNLLVNLLQSKTALDATQQDSLKILLNHYTLPTGVHVSMKETLMLVLSVLAEEGDFTNAKQLLKSPTDVLRYLWYEHTGFLQLVEPKTIIKRTERNHDYLIRTATGKIEMWKSKVSTKEKLALKYTRKECLMVATWLNNMEMDIEQMCEIMHPKRGMWVRFIRALRLAEYSKRPGFEKLKDLLDFFYNEAYTVWQGKVEHYRLRLELDNTMKLLKQRPGLFARSLFANMLWFGPETVTAAFAEVADKVPARLLLSIGMYAGLYFDGEERYIKPLGGVSKRRPANQLLRLYSVEQRDAMKQAVEQLVQDVMTRRFAAQANTNKSIYIDPLLFKIPVPIGDRGETLQDLPSTQQGARFAIEGKQVRLFMQWGVGLHAQHLDMDLSCQVVYADKSDICSYSRLTAPGLQHSGDIRHIPEKIGTAEYINIDVAELQRLNAQYVVFTCNAYTTGSLSPNMVVGWMNSKHPMKISEKTGVAYDPSCVQHQVHIESGLTKGLVFGVLDVAANEIIWLEMPFQGLRIQEMNVANIKALLKRLQSKLTVGDLLTVKAHAQQLTITDSPGADENYTATWAMDAAAVTRLFVD
jgi:hypothetical protein